MNDEEWLRFATCGTPNVVSVTRLTSDLTLRLGSKTNLVRIRHDYALKATYKHRLLAHHFPMLPITIDLGRVVKNSKGQLSFFFYDRAMFQTWFQASLKTNAAGDEIWVMTFHKSRQDEVDRLTRRATLIRPEKW